MNRFLALKKKPSPLITVLGYFDGVHLGHRSLLAAAEKLRKEYGGRIAVWTFDALPGKDILTPSSLRAGWLLQYGADLVIFDSFERVKNMNPGRFTAEVLRENLGSLACVCGYNYHFGSGGAADAAELERLCRENGILCITAGEIKGYAEGKSVTVCSTLIRRLVSEGKLADAYSLLGHHFAACGEVVHGRQFGRTAGMPTINQLPPHNGIMPPDGVYATYCMIEGGYYPSVTNIGCRPTFFGNGEKISETHIIGYSGNLYGKNIPVGYIRRIRGEKKFDSAEELVREVERNIITAKKCFDAEQDKLCLPLLVK